MEKKNTTPSYKKWFNRWEITDPVALGKMIIRVIWFLGAFILLALFVRSNWADCVNFKCITGYNILFSVFVLLLLFPLITGIKIFAMGSGIEMTSKHEYQNQMISRITEKLQNEVETSEVSGKYAEDTKNADNDKQELEKTHQELSSKTANFAISDDNRPVP